MERDGKHTCPGCRAKRIPDRLLTCAPCWYDLPTEIRGAVLQTAQLTLLAPRRKEALRRAFDHWRERDRLQKQADGGVNGGR